MPKSAYIVALKIEQTYVHTYRCLDFLFLVFSISCDHEKQKTQDHFIFHDEKPAGVLASRMYITTGPG
jgi:hypothetical protein